MADKGRQEQAGAGNAIHISSSRKGSEQMGEIYYVKSVDNSRLKPLANPRDPRHYALFVLLGSLLLTVGVLAGRGRFQSLEYGYQQEHLEHQKLEMEEANRKLRLEEASLGDPVRIDWIARNELGMTPLAPGQIFRAEAPARPALVARQRSTARSAPLGPSSASILLR